MFKTALEFPVNCLSLNRDCSQIVAAGRSVFKVFNVEEDRFTEHLNLRVGRNINLNYCTLAVAWNPVDDHIIASAATNGAVVTWNLQKSGANKQDLVYNDHKRAVNKVAFHKSEYHILLSGSADGYMKIFDLRKKGVSSEFFGRSEGVRDIQFNPHQYFQFAAAFDNGSVQMWDMRNNRRSECQFPAHGEPVLSLDFHPEERFWIGTSGRDKLIKVWDMTNSAQPVNSHVVQNINGVAQIKWRPQRKYHIASCALLLDFSVNVWDIRRPYIPFAAFNQHKDCVTGIVWKGGDPKTFFTSSKDCTMYAHNFEMADRPADKANPVSVHVDTHGRILHSSTMSSNSGNEKNTTLTTLSARFRKAPDKSEQFTRASSHLHEYTLTDDLQKELDMTWFTESAQQYKLTGRTVEDMCQHNARVASLLNRSQVAQSWNVLRLLYSCKATTPPVSQMPKPTLLNEVTTSKPDVNKEEGKSGSEKEDQRVDSCDTADTGETVTESSSSDTDDGRDQTLTNIASGQGRAGGHREFFFDDTDLEPSAYDYDELSTVPDSQDGSLPEEALQLRVDVGNVGGESPQHSLHNLHPHHSTTDNHIPTVAQTTDPSNLVRQKLLSTPQFTDIMNQWKFRQHVTHMLQHYADMGDVQMSVSVLIVLGDSIRPHIDEILQEQWYMAYIELLSRFKLFTVANRIMKLSKLSTVEMLNQRSTTIHVNCAKCNKQMPRAGWLCDRCCNFVHTCSLCHQPVKGLYVWCQGCSHGGHIEHMKHWFASRQYCPTGCGHLCEYAPNVVKHR